VADATYWAAHSSLLFLSLYFPCSIIIPIGINQNS
jgi:hypothetical protein